MDEKLKQAANEIDEAVVSIEAVANRGCDVGANVENVLQFIGRARARLVEAGESHKATFAREALQRAADSISATRDVSAAHDVLVAISKLLTD
jgi:hypothetical protein